MELSLKDRVILANQFRILELLDRKNADYYSRHREALECGYKLHYCWIAEHFDKEEMTVESCEEIVNILEMHRIMKNAYEQIADKSDIDVDKISLTGFDGNNEAAQLAYARYFAERLDRFKELHPVHNSHVPMLQAYRRMLDEWNKIADKYNLTKTDILRIVNARMYLSNRDEAG